MEVLPFPLSRLIKGYPEYSLPANVAIVRVKGESQSGETSQFAFYLTRMGRSFRLLGGIGSSEMHAVPGSSFEASIAQQEGPSPSIAVAAISGNADAGAETASGNSRDYRLPLLLGALLVPLGLCTIYYQRRVSNR